MTDLLKALLAQYEMAEYEAILHKMVRPAVAWPVQEGTEFCFLGQVALSELSDEAREALALPGGMLSFFYQAGEAFWQDPNFVRVIYSVPESKLATRKPPNGGAMNPETRVSLELSVSLPSRPWWNEDWEDSWPLPTDEYLEDLYDEIQSELTPSAYLFGFPFNTTLAYDPTPSSDWCSLLTLASDESQNWCWHDGDWLVTFIGNAALGGLNFSDIKADAG